MKNFRSSLFALCVVSAGTSVSGSAVAQTEQIDDRRFRMNIGMDYSSGSYGQEDKTEILYVPLSLRAEDGPWTVRAVVPWLYVKGPALILDGADGGSVGTRTRESDSGLGDLSLSLMYSFEQFYEKDLFIDLTARVKIPTASLERGLGTGQADAALQVDVAQSFGAFIPFATLGYKWAGVPEGFKLRNTVYGSVGLQYAWSDRVATGVSYDYRQSSFKDSPDPQDGTAYLNIRFADDWSVNIYGVMGFSENSPDAGAGVSFVYRFTHP
jgi:opacity protein-like surface antigen